MTELAIVLISSTVIMVVYWFGFGIIDRPLGQPGARRDFAIKKIIGGMVLGGLPLLIAAFVVPDFSLAAVGLSLTGTNPLLSVAGIAAAIALTIPITYRANVLGGDPDRYPELRIDKWERSDYLLWLVGWFVFLFFYEVVFRGVLFLLLLPVLGFPMSLAINLAVYVLSHVQKGLRETVGCFILGTVLCYASAWSGTLWIAIWIHFFLAIVNGFWAIRFLKKHRA